VLKQARRGVRLIQIGDLLIKHGLGSILDFLGVAPRLFGRPAPNDDQHSIPVPHRVRLLLQDLGPTFIKLGQIASTRSDLLSDDFIRELRKLQDAVEPIPFEQIKMVIQEELGKPVELLFSSIEPIPVASASIGQVHRAQTLDGHSVVVKVQRPGVAEVIRDDIGILSWAARRLEGRVELARQMNVVRLLEEFEDILLDELLYTIEGRSADRIRRNLATNSTICIPEVYWEQTSRRVITLEDVSGIKLTSTQELADAGINLHDLAVALSQAYMKQILIDGFFHGDPHQGNYFVSPSGRIALVDFGIMGRLDERTRDTLVQMFIAIYHQDSEQAVQHLVSLGAVSPDTDMAALTRDVDRLLSKYYFLPRKEVRIGEVMNRVLEVVHRHDVRMPTDLALLTKVLLTIEGICLQLDSDFDFSAAVEPFARELMERSFSPTHLARDLSRNAREASRIARLAPGQLMALLDKAEHGRLRIIVQYDHSDRSLDHFYEIGNRLAMSLGLAAMLIGSALVLQTHVAPLLGYIGFVISLLFMLSLMFSLVWGLPMHRRGSPRRPR
jgi:ubiquinone biosynthesis protein